MFCVWVLVEIGLDSIIGLSGRLLSQLATCLIFVSSIENAKDQYNAVQCEMYLVCMDWIGKGTETGRILLRLWRCIFMHLCVGRDVVALTT